MEVETEVEMEVEMEDGFKSVDALIHENKQSVSILTFEEGISNDASANDSMPPSKRTKVGYPCTLDVEQPASNGVSVRIERLGQCRSQSTISAVEFEIEASKVHWSELDNPRGEEEVDSPEAELEYFLSLKKKWPGNFFWEHVGDHWMVGEKIAEGGQAEIFIAEEASHDGTKGETVMKVFKEGFLLRDLDKQWPLGMLQNPCPFLGNYNIDFCTIYGAVLLKNGRFGFVMPKCWGDLRKLIDFRMQHNHNQSTPFTKFEEGHILEAVALGMQELHINNIIHRDLKASNVLIRGDGTFDPVEGKIWCNVADFECSPGVVGTGYWRAPEILQAIQNHTITVQSFSKESDVYSFAMTSYEVLTGCIPFEDLGKICYNIVIEGRRPELPQHIDPLLETLLNKCWHENPLKRPSFEKIIKRLLRLNLALN